jgi:hypothetical protein
VRLMQDEMAANTITPVTRREITDYLASSDWAGNLNEHDFLARLYDLSKLPSADRRPEYSANASADICQHRVNNSDWGGAQSGSSQIVGSTSATARTRSF